MKAIAIHFKIKGSSSSLNRAILIGFSGPATILMVAFISRGVQLLRSIIVKLITFMTQLVFLVLLF